MTMVLARVYIPSELTSKLSLEHLKHIAPPRVNAGAGRKFPRILAGNFSSPKLLTLFEEWAQEAGVWPLSAPRIPTSVVGSLIDKLLVAPGHYMP